MGSALLSQWVAGPDAITVINPSPRPVPDGVTLLSSPEQLGDRRFDCIIAAVKPQMFDDVMPNMPSAIGRGVSGLFAAPDVTDAQAEHAAGFMKLAGSVIVVADEDRIDRVTTVAGSGPGYIFEIARAYVDAAMAQGFTKTEARDMVLETMAGTVAMAIANPDTPLDELRDTVTSKGGTTAAGLHALNGDGEMTRRMHATLEACYDRAVELR